VEFEEVRRRVSGDESFGSADGDERFSIRYDTSDPCGAQRSAEHIRGRLSIPAMGDHFCQHRVVVGAHHAARLDS